MPLIVAEPHEQALTGLEAHLAHMLQPRSDVARQVNLVGPFDAYGIAEQDILRGSVKACRPIGWCGLVTDDAHEPLACVDILHHPEDGPAYAVEGADAARRLHDALHIAEDFARTTPQRYRVRLLRLHRLQIDAVWLQGRHTRVIVMRDATRPGAEPLPMTRGEFRRLVVDRLRDLVRRR